MPIASKYAKVDIRSSLEVQHMDIKAIGKTAYPDYRGRKFRLSTRQPVDVRSYWDGGSRDYFVAIDLKTMRTMAVPQNGTPFDGGPIRPNGVEVPTGFAIVEHSYFCGKDIGLTIHVQEDTSRMLTA